jgi:hypothetical protein
MPLSTTRSSAISQSSGICDEAGRAGGRVKGRGSQGRLRAACRGLHVNHPASPPQASGTTAIRRRLTVQACRSRILLICSGKLKGERRGLNPRPPGPQPGALPTELRPPGQPQIYAMLSALPASRPSAATRGCSPGTPQAPGDPDQGGRSDLRGQSPAAQGGRAAQAPAPAVTPLRSAAGEHGACTS